MKQFPPLLVNVKQSTIRVDFNAEWNRSAAQEKATHIKWQQVCACPCGTEHTKDSQAVFVRDSPVSCDACGGTGRLYGPAQDTLALITDASRMESTYALWGGYSRGSISVTFMPENLPAEWDRITLSEGHIVLTDRRVRKATVERPRYPISKRKVAVGSGAGCTTPRDVIVGVIGAYKLRPDGTTDPAPMEESVDFVVTDDGYIDWTLGDARGSAPALGQQYGVRYFARPVYVVRDFAYMRRDFYELRKGDLVYVQHPVAAIALLEHLGPPVIPSWGISPTEVNNG